MNLSMNRSIYVILVFLGLVGVTALEPQPGQASEQRGVQVVGTEGTISGLSGKVTLTSQESPTAARAVQFNDTVQKGDVIKTESDAHVELLLGKAAFVHVGEHSVVTLKQTRILELLTGSMEVSVAGSRLGPKETIEIKTPQGTIRVKGGVMKVTAIQAAVSPAAGTTRGLTKLEGSVQVLEGTVQLISTKPGAPPTTLTAGQSAQLAPGVPATPQALPQIPNLDMMNRNVPAIAQHRDTGDPGREHLMRLQMTKAVELGQTVLGSPTDKGGKLAGATGSNITIVKSGGDQSGPDGGSSGGTPTPGPGNFEGNQEGDGMFACLICTGSERAVSGGPGGTSGKEVRTNHYSAVVPPNLNLALTQSTVSTVIPPNLNLGLTQPTVSAVLLPATTQVFAPSQVVPILALPPSQVFVNTQTLGITAGGATISKNQLLR